MPKWLDQDRFDLETKVTTADLGPAARLRDDDDLRHMVQTLLIERFHLKAHTEDRPRDAYTLTAADPKLRKTADPTARSHCINNSAGPNAKDPRLTTPILNRLLYCQNMSVPELAEDLQGLAGGYIFSKVFDDTGLKDRYDFTINFSGTNLLKARNPDGTSDPSGALSVFDALNRQLGLKLEKQTRPQPVLVIDHIDETPTEN